LIALGVAVMPAAREVFGKGPQMKRLMDAVQKRLSVLVYISIAGLVLTGLLQANRNPAFQGLFSLGNAYSTFLTIKHILVGLMIVVALYRSLVLGRRSGALSPSQEKLSAGLLFLNILLGVGVLLLTGLSVALGAPSAA
jgi:putative copper export protein